MYEPFTANQALQLLWVHFVQPKEYKVNLKLTKAEVKHLQLELLDKWDTLTTHYKKQLVTKDKLDLLRIMSRNEPMFLGM